MHEYISFGFSWQHLLFISELESWNVRSNRGLRDFWVQWFLNWALQSPQHLCRGLWGPQRQGQKSLLIGRTPRTPIHSTKAALFLNDSYITQLIIKFCFKIFVSFRKLETTNLLHILRFTIKASRLQERYFLFKITNVIDRLVESWSSDSYVSDASNKWEIIEGKESKWCLAFF